MPSFVVIGGGAVGCTITYRLAAAGADVTMLDAGDPGSGTTSASFAISIATRKTPRDHHNVAVSGMAEHRRLAAELDLTDSASWVHPAPVYEWATSEHDRSLIAARVARLNEWDYPAQWIDGRDLLDSEPHLDVDPQRLGPVALYPNECWYDPELMVQTLLAAAQKRGAVIKGRTPVTDLTVTGSSVIVQAGEESYTADRVVLCAGPQSQQLASLAGLHLPVTQAPGLIVRSAPVPEHTLRGIVLLPHINMRPAPHGQIIAHSYTTESALPNRVSDPVGSSWAKRVLTHSTRLLPAFGKAGIESADVGLRPIPADGLPIVGHLEGSPVYSVVAHSGINLAPVLSELAAHELLNEAARTELTPFRPHRLSLTSEETLDESTREMNRILTNTA